MCYNAVWNELFWTRSNNAIYQSCRETLGLVDNANSGLLFMYYPIGLRRLYSRLGGGA